jgi:hypothetical protein
MVELAESFGDFLMEENAPGCEFHATSNALKKRDPEMVLKLAHLLANGAGCHSEFFGGGAHRAAPAYGLESLQRMEGGHGHSVISSPIPIKFF